ncbi:phosphate/phosphite/phosphonate ABC transporter substrate-binding protein [Pseudonocardia sp.]|jgi:phosphonate transport system substrate-binding protein|uniref:phosphate/phosphite/phosphonate ABC transporter substrate-binding protein n=1 Tax=Pseudonocardia sp. TaxID=60912 RepID=UPI0031FCA194
MNRTLRHVLPAVAAVLLTVALAACGESASTATGGGGTGAADPDTLVFAAVPSEQSTSLQADFKPVLDMLARETGKKIEFRQATDYAAVIEGQLSGQVQIAQYGPLSFVLAQAKGAAITPVGAQISAKGATPGYQSYAITKAGSPIKSIADFAGKKICFVDPNSTSGYLYPTAALLQAGIDPTTGIQPIFAGGHDASVLEVASGRCDAGFAEDSMVDTTLIQKGQLKPGDITTLWKSDIIPGSPVAISTSLSPELQAKLTDAFQNKANADYLKANGFCAGTCTVGDGGYWGYAPVDNAFYDPIRKVCDTTKNKNCTTAS